MNELPATMLVLPALGLLAAGLLPSRWADRYAVALRHLITTLAAVQLILGILAVIALMTGIAAGNTPLVVRWPADTPLAIGVYLDGVSGLMFALVSFVGWIICRFSIRYLDGQPTQGRYFRWTAVTLGAVSLMVVSGNLLMFFVAWVTTSLGLHRLLLHYGDRPAARRAAWTKFLISRLGDVSLIAALALTYWQFRTFDFAPLFAAVQAGSGDSAATGGSIAWIGWLLIAGAVTKSAQLPFHTWLPQTLETPTPVSALMHAGIVNAGGFLVIRTSPLLQQTPAALTALAVIGTLTACYASVVMLTQTSIKRSLAYSTIAQMGFMMLQCGVGAFSAAMLHILAHSLYKAHAFLGSGSVLTQAAATRGSKGMAAPAGWRQLAAAATITVASFGAALAGLGIDPASKPGGVLLGFVLCLALTAWLSQIFTLSNLGAKAAGSIVTALLALVYVVSFVVVDQIVRSNPAVTNPQLSMWLIAPVVAIGFSSLFSLRSRLLRESRPSWLNTLYIHASNGFYFDAILRRVAGRVTSS